MSAAGEPGAVRLDKDALLSRSRTFCMAPWTHLHVLTDGLIFPCCISAHDPSNAVGNLRNGDSLRSAWNSGAMRELRGRMLRGEPSQACERCYAAEALGQRSWRTAELVELAHHFPVVEATDAEGALAEPNLRYLDVRFSNVCNLRCRICAPHLSSSWYADAAKLGVLELGGSAIVTAAPDPEALWRELVELVPRCERFHFAGGEPLLMEEHYRVLERLLETGRHHVKLSYNTNLSRLAWGKRDVVEMWKRFPNVYVQASLDGSGRRGEYMRKGLVWSAVVENRRRLQRECPHVAFCLLPTVSVMNVLHVPDFYREWLEAGLIGPSDIQLNILFEPRFYNVRGLPVALKRRVDDSYRRFIDDHLGGPGCEETRGHFEAVLRHMWAEDWDVAVAFGRYTKALDRLRGESFLEVFPELGELGPGWWEERDPQALLERAQAKRASGDRRGALEDCARAVMLAPEAALGRLDHGIRSADANGLRLLPPPLDSVAEPDDFFCSPAFAHYMRGVARRQLGDRAGASADFERSLALDPRLEAAGRAREDLSRPG